MPSRSTLIRWGGLAAVAAGVLRLLEAFSAIVGVPATYVFARPPVSGGLSVLALLLMLVALVGLHARQAGSRGYGRLGTAGFLLALLGDLLAAALGPLVYSGVAVDVSPSLVVVVVTGGVAAAAELGLLLLGVATLRAAVLPSPWRALPVAIFLLGFPLITLAGPLFPAAGGIALVIFIAVREVLLGLGWALLGYALWSEMGEGAWRRPARVRGASSEFDGALPRRAWAPFTRAHGSSSHLGWERNLGRVALSDALGSHACECGHPGMRRLPAWGLLFRALGPRSAASPAGSATDVRAPSL